MNASCDQCICAGVGRCPACQAIKATVARESAPPAQRTAPVTVAGFLATSGDAGRLVAAARAALERLTVLQRQVLVLRFVDGLTRSEVARRLALPSRAVPGLCDAAETKLTQHRPVTR